MMKVKCCNGCVVNAMCTVGCDNLWIYYTSLQKKTFKHLRFMDISIKFALVIAIVNGIFLLSGFTVPMTEDSSYYVIKYFGITYWYPWVLISYTIPLLYNVFYMTRRVLVKRIMLKIMEGRLGGFIDNKEFEEAVKKNKREHAGGTTI
jgi:hypothetical protein